MRIQIPSLILIYRGIEYRDITSLSPHQSRCVFKNSNQDIWYNPYNYLILYSYFMQKLSQKDIMEIMVRDWRVSIHWIHRDGNSAADWLVKYGHSLLFPSVCFISQPVSELQLLLLKNSLIVP